MGQAARKTIAKSFSKDKLLEKLKFLEPEKLNVKNIRPEGMLLNIVVDGVFLQLYQTGIARVWRSLLEEWATNGFAKHLVVLNRATNVPKIPGIRYRTVSPYEYHNRDADPAMLQQVCDEEGADLFISTYYTRPLSTPSVVLMHDMIPELMGWELNPLLQDKRSAIQQAVTHITVSENTASDLVRSFPHISLESITVAHNGVDHQTFSPAKSEDINQFKTKYGISKPYFILVGVVGGYKNTILFFKAFTQLYSKHGFEIVCTGVDSSLEAEFKEFRNFTAGCVVHTLQLSDQELRAAYSGAAALVYPSKYEGFGLPILEAITCGCPVITCHNASIPEVAGEAALYVDDNNVQELVNALCEVQKPEVRQSLITAGLEQSKKFSWSKMAEQVSSALINATLLPLKLKDINLIIFPEWSQPEESLCAGLQQVIEVIATHPNSGQMTLLVDIGNISMEDAALILSSVTMNLLLQEELDISEGPEISLMGELSAVQWEALLSRIHARIVLESENQSMLIESRAKNIPSYELNSFSSTPVHELKARFWELNRHPEVAHFIRGIGLRKQGELAEAMKSYQKALEIKHDFPEALQQLNMTCYENQVRLKGYQFTQDWFSWNIPVWKQYLKHFIDIPDLNILEIGSWEGRSTCWLLDNIMIHDSHRITCVDTFEGSVEHQIYDFSYIRTIEERFDFNILKTGGVEKVKKIVGTSNEIMRNLSLNYYDVIYIDGSHVASDVLEDAVLAWQLLKIGGYMIFDDYPFAFAQNPTWNTRIGVDAFITTFNDKLRMIHKAYQVIIEKTTLKEK
ncbi:MAG: class I SAM-dependent methyltransferase [Chroococcidiopsidaceae cyanobacterium CP_BM_RX_35]|nr:class I SAM-dependent methyltransferase [Chroococcidiopsidaceae cyanobacterium CP_BM_RX_35]